MKTRTVKELLEILLDNIDLIGSSNCKGLCRLAFDLYFIESNNYEEYKLVKKYIENNISKNKWDPYGWKPGLKYLRERWLKKHIKLLSK